MTDQLAPWITFRPEIKVLDCTVRDGGLINDHQFKDGFVKGIYKACLESGIDYMELGLQKLEETLHQRSVRRLEILR